MLNVFGVVFTSKNKNTKRTAFLLGSCSSSNESCHLIFCFRISLCFPHIQPIAWHSLSSQSLSPFPPCSFWTPPSSAASWLSPLPFCAKSVRLLRSLCSCQWGQHTHRALLDVHYINQEAAFCSLYSLSSLKNFFSSPSLSQLLPLTSSTSLYPFTSPRA